MRLPFRVVLPVSLGCVALALMLWDVHNQRACGGWCDTILPVWPYQASFLFLRSINAPAFVVAAPFFLLPHLQTYSARYPVLLPVIVLWWWWLGTRIDFGLLGSRYYRRPKLWAVVMAAMATALLCGGAWLIADEVHRWLRYGPVHPLLLATMAGLTLWWFALAGGCILAAFRLLHGRFPPVTDRRPQRPIIAYGLVFVALVAVTTSLIGYARETRLDPDSCLAWTDSGCIHGTVSDNGGKPLKGIEVEVLPAEKTGEARWYSKKAEWTDVKGRYSVNQMEPGEYLVAVHYDGAPDMRQPFATTFYPGVQAERGAARVVAVRNSPTILKQLRLRSLSLTTMKVEVVWPDGTRPKRSNLLFHNRSYPSQAVIGDVAPQVDDGAGEFTLLEGFLYLATASVQCDAGQAIETRESRPVQEIEVAAGATPRIVTFTIPGTPCKLWRPK